MMTLVNEIYDSGATKGEVKVILSLLNPFAPHITEELWEQLGEKDMLSLADWPSYDEAKCVATHATFAVQVNGKLRSTVELAADASDEEIVAAALADDKVKKYTDGLNLVKTIVVKGKLVNLIVK